MPETTGIAWTDATFNPWIGCEKVSPGCAHCYAETLATGRMGRPGTWGAEGTRERTSPANWNKPLRWERLAQEGLLPDGRTAAVDELGNPRRPRVFCASMADVFEPRPEVEPWRDELFALIEQTPSLDWQLLTKRPELARDWLRGYYERRSATSLLPVVWHGRTGTEWETLPNIWIGTSIENARHTWRADVLREIPAPIRFISAEPLLGSLLDPRHPFRSRRADEPLAVRQRYADPLSLTGIDWLIVGGESGGRTARPMHPAWARELRDAVFAAGNGPLDEAFVLGAPEDVLSEGIRDEHAGRDRPSFLFKQWGSWIPVGRDELETRRARGGIYSGLLEDGSRVTLAYAAETPGGEIVRYAGAAPTSGGKHLDGCAWQEFPEPTVSVLA